VCRELCQQFQAQGRTLQVLPDRVDQLRQELLQHLAGQT
jgi:hypothetical protein